MEALKYNDESKSFDIRLTEREIEDLIMYLGHGRHAKALDYLNYKNLDWKESAEVAKKTRDQIEATMNNFNEILLTAKQ